MKAQATPKDPLLEEAKKLLLEKSYVSPSLLQRGLRVSYSRAMRLMNELESEGVVTAPNAAGHRQLISDAS